MQNIPNPDVNSTENEGNKFDIERENNRSDVEDIPLPPDEPKPVPIEEPLDDTDRSGIDKPKRAPKEIVLNST
jgi:hypothetical protein